MGCRVLQKNDKKITFVFKGEAHKGIDLVGPGSTLDYITAHSDGTVVAVVSNINYNTSKTGQRIYGNYVKIKHDNGMYTLYAHMQYGSVKVKVGDRVSKGQVIGYMGNTGYAFGAHLHFEVRNTEDKYIDPTPYIDADLPQEQTPQEPTNLSHKVGDVVTINGVYVSSTSDNKLVPAVRTGTITKIIAGARNPYLLNDGNIGWVNDSCIVSSGNSATDNSIKVGDKVRVKQGAKSYDGVALESFVYDKIYDVIEATEDRAVIGIGKAVTTDIHVSDLYKEDKTSEPSNTPYEPGNKVRVKRGAKSYDGVALEAFVYDNVYDIIQVNGDRAVIGIGNAVTTAIHVSDLYK